MFFYSFSKKIISRQWNCLKSSYKTFLILFTIELACKVWCQHNEFYLIKADKTLLRYIALKIPMSCIKILHNASSGIIEILKKFLKIHVFLLSTPEYFWSELLDNGMI